MFEIKQTQPFYITTKEQWNDLCVQMNSPSQKDAAIPLPTVAIGVAIGPLVGIIAIEPQQLVDSVSRGEAAVPVEQKPESAASKPTEWTQAEITEMVRQITVIRQNMPAILGRLMAHQFILVEADLISESRLEQVYAAHQSAADRLVAEMFDAADKTELPETT